MVCKSSKRQNQTIYGRKIILPFVLTSGKRSEYMADIFKGYLKSNGKVPTESIKNSELHPTPPEGDYVGILKDDIIQLDFDDDESSKLIMSVVREYKLKCDILKTSRGIHLYFKNDGYTKSQSVGIYNAMGVKCDIGLGNKYRAIPLKITKEITVVKIVNGHEVPVNTVQTTEREWIQTYDELDIIPPYFRPFSKVDQEFGKTETRNQALFDYILRLQFHGFTREEVRRTLKVVNKYMLYEPLSDRELDVITRDEAFSEELFFEGKSFLHHRFGDYMLANSNILLIDNQVQIYTESGVYSNDPNEFEKQMLLKIPSLKDAHRKEVYKYISLKVKRRGEYANPKYIGLKDTILDIETMEEFQYSPKWVITNKIEYSYNPHAYSEVMDKTLTKVACNDPQIRALIEEMVGYSIFRGNIMQSCFILTGEGSNGKSTILNVIKKLLGKGNYTSLDLRELEENFKPAELYNKLANIGDDISSRYLENSSVFKKVVTGESFMVAKKYGQPFELESYATQIFCANELPQVNDKSDGFSRRIVIVPFNASFSKKDPDYDPFIEDKLLADEALEYLLKIAIDGLKRLIENRQFTKTDAGEKEKQEYLIYNDNTLEWLDSEPKIDNEEVGDVYLSYQVWCSRNGTHPVKKLNLSKTLKKHGGYISKPKSIDGKTVRVYVKE